MSILVIILTSIFTFNHMRILSPNVRPNKRPTLGPILRPFL